MFKFTRTDKGVIRAVIISIEIDLEQGKLGQLSFEQVQSNITARLASLKAATEERDR
jgi:hypothetical protein